MLLIIIVVILLLALIGTLPVYPYSANYTFYPAGGLGLLLLVVLILWVLGLIPR